MDSENTRVACTDQRVARASVGIAPFCLSGRRSAHFSSLLWERYEKIFWKASSVLYTDTCLLCADNWLQREALCSIL